MLYLIDTNLLLRFVDRNHPLQSVIRSSIRRLRLGGHLLVVAPQNFIEFWNVATRPVAANGFGLTSAEAEQRLGILERLFAVLPETAEVYPEWRRIVVQYGVSGVQVHDARLIAWMQVNSVSHVLTKNVRDFNRYSGEGIVAVDPVDVP